MKTKFHKSLVALTDASLTALAIAALGFLAFGPLAVVVIDTANGSAPYARELMAIQGLFWAALVFVYAVWESPR